METSPEALTTTSCHLDQCQCDRLRPCFTRDVIPLRAELLREALRLTHRGPDAEDLVQDTVLRAYRSLGTFRPGTNVRAWMYRILKNTWISNYRASQRRLTEVPMEEFTEGPGDGVVQQSGVAAPELTVIAAQPDTEVQSAMAGLSDEFRMVVYLADVQGYPYAAIADMMNTPLGTVMSRLHRARRQLRVDLGGAARRRRLLVAA
ncbi:ECF RNA polymerase sigma factor SigH [Mycolicibacterium arabiense]|uniref:ECF RNA polymerase sigma factor SigH n=1 Tax=Mycolicibacterium arabiense TaxID=1286181 RepID=A0A7I7RTV7_9MYCO|nr:sigma-70 family RNA polymerase sigma factor [Mycolicibacterium arabiense]MCV7375708.1 sigma-70 family RNA polymerase sigma factor [Mycolicibacterium arabiense]BBY47631.1 ECF RNA polymerase sigma factor SigH [Mycolicibacterium arabiense]